MRRSQRRSKSSTSSDCLSTSSFPAWKDKNSKHCLTLNENTKSGCSRRRTLSSKRIALSSSTSLLTPSPSYKAEKVDKNEMEFFISEQKKLLIEKAALDKMKEKQALMLHDLKARLNILEDLHEIQKNIESILQRMKNFLIAHKQTEFDRDFLEHILTHLESIDKLRKIYGNVIVQKTNLNGAMSGEKSNQMQDKKSSIPIISITHLYEFKQMCTIIEKHLKMIHEKLRKEVLKDGFGH